MQTIGEAITEIIEYETNSNVYRYDGVCNHNIECDKQKNKIISLYNSWGNNITSINDITDNIPKINIEYADMELSNTEIPIFAYDLHGTLVLYDGNSNIYWYSKYGHLHNYQFPKNGSIYFSNNTIFFTDEFSFNLCIENYLDATYTVKLEITEKLDSCDLDEYENTITCVKCNSKGRNIKSARN